MSKSLCIIAVAILGVGIMASSACAARTKRKPVLSCDTYSLRNYFQSKEIDYFTVPKLLKEMGIPGVAYNDIWMESWDNAYLDKVKQACREAGVRITCLICEGNLATQEEAKWEEQIKTDEKKMRAAAYLGAPVVRLNIGGLGDEKLDATVGVQRAIAAFKRLLPLAKELNVKMTIENHGGVSKKADWILEIIKGTDPKWVGACLDFGNWPDEIRNSESAKLAPYAYHTHMKCHTFTADGEDTNKDYKYLLGLLKSAGYRYAVSIEYEGPDDQKIGVAKSRDLILKYWPELSK